MQFSLPSRRGLGPRPPKARFPRLEGQIDRIWGTPPESKGASSAKPPKKPNHAPLLPKTSGCREPKKTTQKQLKWPRRDSNPGRGRSTPRPFFARPKPHHPSMRLGGRALESVLFMPKSEDLAPLVWVLRGAAAAPWPRTIKSAGSSLSICGFRYLSLEGSYLGPQMAVGPVSRAKPLPNGVSHPNPKGRPVQSRQKREPRATKKRTHCSGPGWREQKKQLKCARRDSNPGRGRSRGRPFFARPKPHHPTMRLGEVEHSKVSYLYQKVRI